MDIRNALARLADGGDLATEEMAAVMRQIMTGEAEDAQIGAFLLGLRIKGETLDEITGAVQVMRELATGVATGGMARVACSLCVSSLRGDICVGLAPYRQLPPQL